MNREKEVKYKFKVDKDGRVFVNGHEIKMVNSYSVATNEAGLTTVDLSFDVSELKIKRRLVEVRATPVKS